MLISIKKLLLLLLLSLGLIGISYADDSQAAVEREIAAFESELALELERQAIEQEIASYQENVDAHVAADLEREKLIEALVQYYKDNTIVDFIDPGYAKYLWLGDIVAKVKSYWRYQGAEDDWVCTAFVQQDVDGNVEAVNIQNCNTGDSDKARSFKNSIERAVYKASPLPISPDDAVFRRELMFYFRAI